MPFTKDEQLQFEKMVKDKLVCDCPSRQWIKKVADFLFEMTGDVNRRMAIFVKYGS